MSPTSYQAALLRAELLTYNTLYLFICQQFLTPFLKIFFIFFYDTFLKENIEFFIVNFAFSCYNILKYSSRRAYAKQKFAS